MEKKDLDNKGLPDLVQTKDALASFTQTNFDSSSSKVSAAKKILNDCKKFNLEVSENSAVYQWAHKSAKIQQAFQKIEELRYSIKSAQELIKQASK